MSVKRYWLVPLLASLLLVPFLAVSRTRADDEKKFNLIYVPTDEKVIEKMFEMAKITKKDVVFDLGCGDGRINAMACKKFGCSGVGIDLNPERIKECMDTIKKYGVEDYVEKFKLEYRLGNALTAPRYRQGHRDHALHASRVHGPARARRPQDPQARLAHRLARLSLAQQGVGAGHHDRVPGPSRNHTLYLWTVKGKEEK